MQENKAMLKSFSRALTREAHVLTQQPDLLWQQLYNRLQWEGEEVKQVLIPASFTGISCSNNTSFMYIAAMGCSEVAIR